MNEEDFIKRLVQLAEGFGYTDRNVYYRDKIYFSFNGLKKTSLYPLLLYRAVEGWNRQIPEPRLVITFEPTNIFVSDLDKDWKAFIFVAYQSTKYLTPQEQALEDALKEVLK